MVDLPGVVTVRRAACALTLCAPDFRRYRL